MAELVQPDSASTRRPFPTGGGELGRLIRAKDWSGSPLGLLQDWSSSLKTTVGMMLAAQAQIVLFWGPQFAALYNDAYAPSIGDKHPRALGRPAQENWTELWDDLEPLLQSVRTTGETISAKDRPFQIERHGYLEEVFFDISYSPVWEKDGSVGGVLCIVSETTERVLGQRALAEQKALVEATNRRLTAESAFLQRLFEESPTFIAMLVGREHQVRLANAAYRGLIGGRDVLGKAIRDALPEIEGQGFFEMLDQVYASGQPLKLMGASVQIQREAGKPLETRHLDFIYQPVTNSEGEVTGIFVEGQDVTERTLAERHLQLMVNELNHRMKNTLAMIQAIAAQTFRNAEDVEQAQASFSGRIMALSRANDLLTGERWVGASLQDVIDKTIEPYCTDSRGHCRINGPVVQLTAKTALSLSMALHELSTNALKYGAWSVPDGWVEIGWRLSSDGDGQRLCLEWREHDGPPVSPPKRRGFGSRLIERGLAAEMGGQVRLDFQPTGLVCTVDAPLEQDGEAP